MPRPSAFSWIAMAALCGLAWLAYAPGLSGGFLFDDLVNLPALGATGAVDDWPTFWRYITSGGADPTGRPLALLTFLLDARDWPADPHPFLRTNVVLHLCNGMLLFALLRLLGRRVRPASHSATDMAAVLGAGLWLLHPLFVSTTLYIVQREAMLPASFTLLGLLAYVHGRTLYPGRPRAGIAWMLAGIGLGTALATLGKANGILLPLLALVLEATVLRPVAETSQDPVAARRLRRWQLLLLVLPAVVVCAWLASYLPRLGADLDIRPWTIGERLLTEPRVLLDYLRLLFVPRVVSTGLFNDDYIVSTGLLHPASTVPALVLVAALVALGFGLRRRAPVAAAALLFFFAGHLVESTVVPLELYYEHRNYLPALLLFWPLALAVCGWRAPRPWRGGAAAALLSLCAVLTWQRASLWSEPGQMAQLWALQNPDSPRAQAAAAMSEMQAGTPELARRRLQPLLQRRPHDLQLALNLADAACMARGLAPRDADTVAVALRNAAEGGQLAWQWLDRMLGTAASGRCAGLDLDTVGRWLAEFGANPAMRGAGRRQDLAALSGRLSLLRGQPDAALAHFDRALSAYPTPSAAASMAAQLGRQGHYAQALALLDRYERIADRRQRVSGPNMAHLHQRVLDAQGYWPRELAILRATLRDDLAAAGQSPRVAN